MKNRIALAPALAQHPPMLARVFSAIARQSATADVNGIEAFPVEVEVNSGWGDTTVVLIMSISPSSKLFFLRAESASSSVKE
jgi:hypothetical protein